MKSDFHTNGFAFSLALRQRLGRSRKWPISVDSHCVFKIQAVRDGDFPMITCGGAKVLAYRLLLCMIDDASFLTLHDLYNTIQTLMTPPKEGFPVTIIINLYM